MFSRKKQYKTVLQITDTMITSLTLGKDTKGFFIHDHQSLKLPEGVIVHGEILKAEMLSTRLKKIVLSYKEQGTVDIIFPYENFTYASALLEKSSSRKNIKTRIREYFKKTPGTELWRQTHVCEFSHHPHEEKERIVFRCLPQDIFNSYFFLFKKFGFRVGSITSDVLAFDHLFDAERTRTLFVGEQSTRLVEYHQGMYTQSKSFQFSYEQLRKDIMSYTKMNELDANKVLERYGLLRSHPDEKVYKKLVRSLGPLLEVIQKTKLKQTSHVALVFEQTPLKGISDIIEKTTGLATDDFDILKQKKYSFHDVLTVHRKKLHNFYPHIAQALKSFKK